MGSVTRLEKEKEALLKIFPQFRIQDPYGPSAGVLGRMKSSSGKEYVIWLSLDSFPYQAPEAYVISPHPLLTSDGYELGAVATPKGNWRMHLLPPDDHGHPQICHYNDQFWTSNVSIAKVLLKVRLWLEAYEQHRVTGMPIDNLLPHMEQRG